MDKDRIIIWGRVAAATLTGTQDRDRATRIEIFLQTKMSENRILELIGHRKLSSRGRQQAKEFLSVIENYFEEEPKTIQEIQILIERVFIHLQAYNHFYFKIKEFPTDILNAIAHDLL